MPQASLSENLRQVRFLTPLERVELLQVLKQLDSSPSPVPIAAFADIWKICASSQFERSFHSPEG